MDMARRFAGRRRCPGRRYRLLICARVQDWLKHPFYQDWQAGKLTRESLQLYARQYYKHVEAFPEHLRVLAARADESLKPVVLENLAEEENPSRPHPKLWRDFAGALGVS